MPESDVRSVGLALADKSAVSVTTPEREVVGGPRSQEVGKRETTTLRAPLSGTFLQTLPDLVMPLKALSLSPRSCPETRSAPSERFGY